MQAAPCDVPLWWQVTERFKKAHEEIKASMAQLYTFFAADPEEVQREWVKFTQKVQCLSLCAWDCCLLVPPETCSGITVCKPKAPAGHVSEMLLFHTISLCAGRRVTVPDGSVSVVLWRPSGR